MVNKFIFECPLGIFNYFLPLIQASNRNYNTNNFDSLQGQVDEVKGVMTQNIQKILDRGDKLDDLVDKTTNLESSVS